MKREVGGGIGMGNTCISMADSCQCMAKPIQYCKVISLQLNKLKDFLKISADCCDPQSQRLSDSQRSRSRCFSGILLLFQ